MKSRRPEEILYEETFMWALLVALEMDDCFDVVSLREHIESRDMFEVIAIPHEAFEISSQRRGITGNISDEKRPHVDETVDDLLAQPSARWIDQCQTNMFERTASGHEPPLDR